MLFGAGILGKALLTDEGAEQSLLAFRCLLGGVAILLSAAIVFHRPAPLNVRVILSAANLAIGALAVILARTYTWDAHGATHRDLFLVPSFMLVVMTGMGASLFLVRRWPAEDRVADAESIPDPKRAPSKAEEPTRRAGKAIGFD